MSWAPPPSDNLWIGSLPADLDKSALLELFEPYGTIVDCRVLPPKAEGLQAGAMIRFGSVEDAAWLVENMNGNMPEGLEDPIIVRFANPPKTNWKGGDGGSDGVSGGKASGPYGGDSVGQSKGSWKGILPAAKSVRDGGIDGGKGNGAKGQAMPPGTFKTLLTAVTDQFGAMSAPLENQVYVKNLPFDTTDLDLYKLFSPFGAMAPNGVRAMVHPDGTCKGIGFVDFVESAAAALAVEQLDGFECPDGGQINCSLKAPARGSKGKNGKGGA